VKRCLFVLALVVLSISCASSKVSQTINTTYSGPKIKTIALSPGGAVLGDAIGVELFNRGFTVVDPTEAGTLLGRRDLTEFEIATTPNLQTLSSKGVDALLVVKSANASDGKPQSASVRLTSTKTQQLAAAVSWQNGWGAKAARWLIGPCERTWPMQLARSLTRLSRISDEIPGETMRRQGLEALGLAGILLTSFVLPVWSQSSDFIRLDRPSEELARHSNVCPIRVDLPLGKLFEGGGPVYRSGKAAALKCNGAYVSVVAVERYPAARGLKPRIHPKAVITLPGGSDKLARVKYWFMRGDEILSIGEEEIAADGGETSSENGADLWYDKEVGEGKEAFSLSLRIEATFSER
jgi:hypothetical protein